VVTHFNFFSLILEVGFHLGRPHTPEGVRFHEPIGFFQSPLATPPLPPPPFHSDVEILSLRFAPPRSTAVTFEPEWHQGSVFLWPPFSPTFSNAGFLDSTSGW